VQKQASAGIECFREPGAFGAPALLLPIGSPDRFKGVGGAVQTLRFVVEGLGPMSTFFPTLSEPSFLPIASAGLPLCLLEVGECTTLLDEARGSFFHPLELSGFFRHCHWPITPPAGLRA